MMRTMTLPLVPEATCRPPPPLSPPCLYRQLIRDDALLAARLEQRREISDARPGSLCHSPPRTL